MNRFAVLAAGFEGLSYPLGGLSSVDGQQLSHNRSNYLLHRVDSEPHAKILLGSADWLSEHALLPVGFVQGQSGENFIVCQSRGAKADPSSMGSNQKREFSLALVLRLAELHSSGFGCGGLSPDAVMYSRKEAYLSNPSSIFALGEEDPLFYEAVSTLRSLVSSGFAKNSELEGLAWAYLSHSPVCRHAVQSHINGKKTKASPAAALADAARKYAALF